MKKIHIKYNPFIINTDILVDDKKPKANSSLNVGKLRLQEWVGQLPGILLKEYGDANIECLEFTGTLADFEDLKLSFESQKDVISIKSYKHNRTRDVSETEHEVDVIFEEIKAGPIEQLKDESILLAFEKAKNQEFEVNVVATMSSGKSTLINALLDKKLMPVAAKATTATIVRITSSTQDFFSGVAYNSAGKVVQREDNLSLQVMKRWNEDENISTIDIKGPIPCVQSVGMRLVLVDTPGPNNSGDKRHRVMTYKMLDNSDKSLVLFVMNARTLEIDDETNFLNYVCNCMKNGGKQSRERYIFAVNQMDGFSPEDDSIDGALMDVKNNLERRSILQPNIFPVSALAALEARTKPIVQLALPNFRTLSQNYAAYHFESYYDYSHLPKVVDIKMHEYLETSDEDIKAEVHSGIVSIEEAIGLYINKYARTIKVFDLVQSFNNRLIELAAVATLQEEIHDDSAKKEQLESLIAEIRNKIQSGESARSLAALVNDIDLRADVKKEIDEYIGKQMEKINDVIFEYNNQDKVKKEDALKHATNIEKGSNELLDQLEAQIDKILNTTYITIYKTIVNRYEAYVKDLGVSIDENALNINPFTFVAEDVADLTAVLNDNTTCVDEGSYHDKVVKESYQVKKLNILPWHWGTTRYKTKTRDKTIQEWVSVYVDYVNMTEVVSKYFEPIQLQLIAAQDSAMEHVASETTRIKKHLQEQLTEINGVLSSKLTALEQTIHEANETAQEIEDKKRNLEWMNGIIRRINELINF